MVWQALGIPAPVFPSRSAEFQEISSAPRPPLFGPSAHHGGGSGGSARLVCGVPQVVQLNCALPAPGPSFLGAYKRATSRLWGRRGRRFFVALSPPLSPPHPACLFHWSAQSRTAPPFKEGQPSTRHGEEETTTSHSIHGRIDRYSCCAPCTLASSAAAALRLRHRCVS